MSKVIAGGKGGEEIDQDNLKYHLKINSPYIIVKEAEDKYKGSTHILTLLTIKRARSDELGRLNLHSVN